MCRLPRSSRPPVSAIWCLSVNDAFVMGRLGRENAAGGKVRMMADGSADFTRAVDLVLDLTARGLGVLAALLDAGRQRRGAYAGRGPGQVRGQRCSDAAGPRHAPDPAQG